MPPRPPKPVSVRARRLNSRSEKDMEDTYPADVAYPPDLRKLEADLVARRRAAAFGKPVPARCTEPATGRG